MLLPKIDLTDSLFPFTTRNIVKWEKIFIKKEKNYILSSLCIICSVSNAKTMILSLFRAIIPCRNTFTIPSTLRSF